MRFEFPCFSRQDISRQANNGCQGRCRQENHGEDVHRVHGRPRLPRTPAVLPPRKRRARRSFHEGLKFLSITKTFFKQSIARQRKWEAALGVNYEKYPKSTFHCWGVNVDRASYWVKKSNGQAQYELFYETFFAHTGEGAARRLVPPTVVNPAIRSTTSACNAKNWSFNLGCTQTCLHGIPLSPNCRPKAWWREGKRRLEHKGQRVHGLTLQRHHSDHAGLVYDAPPGSLPKNHAPRNRVQAPPSLQDSDRARTRMGTFPRAGPLQCDSGFSWELTCP